jgi:glycosyltransferase involved in cell wall biosynthesis
MRRPFDLAAARRLARICRDEGVDVVHAQFLRENYISMLSRLFRPCTKAFYTSHFILANPLPIRIANRLISFLQTQVIAVCTPGRTQLVRNGVPARKVKVIFNGVDPAFWSARDPAASAASSAALRAEFGIPEGRTVLLCGSRFAHDKGHRFLLDAFALLRSQAPGRFVLLLSNDGPLLEEAKAQADRLGLGGDVVFAGPRGDMKGLYAGADIYLNPSEHEALSFAIIEALASGLPVIATDMGGNPDIINDETKAGVLVSFGDTAGLSAAILRVDGDAALRDSLREAGLAAVRDRFNLDKMASETYNLYIDALNKRS